MNEHKVDATNQSLGRVASKIAILLRGKNRATFKPNVLPNEKVEVINSAKMQFTGKKLEQKVYYKYSGYPGGIRATKLKERMAKSPADVLRTAVYAMLPKNRMRAKIIKHLEIK
ncbi:MAG: 50S ribosomal protein L13 [bacterium]|nr:50S ribosomal protein L13 [bacterium]